MRCAGTRDRRQPELAELDRGQKAHTSQPALQSGTRAMVKITPSLESICNGAVPVSIDGESFTNVPDLDWGDGENSSTVASPPLGRCCSELDRWWNFHHQCSLELHQSRRGRDSGFAWRRHGPANHGSLASVPTGWGSPGCRLRPRGSRRPRDAEPHPRHRSALTMTPQSLLHGRAPELLPVHFGSGDRSNLRQRFRPYHLL